MVSIQLIRAFPFFADFDQNHIETLASVANDLIVDAGHYFFYEGDNINHFYLVQEGKVAINVSIPDRDFEQSISRQITQDLITRDVTTSILQRGEVFGWSAIIPPFESTASVQAVTACRVIEFDYEALHPYIEKECCFGHILTLKAAQIIRERMRGLRIESVAERV